MLTTKKKTKKNTKYKTSDKKSEVFYCFFNSVGSECNPYKVEVVGSIPARSTPRKC